MSDDPTKNENPPPPERSATRGMSPRKWLVGIVLAIVVAIVYYGLRDRCTPIASDCFVQAYVTRIAPQVAGNVTAVPVHDDQRVAAGDLLFEIDPKPYTYAVAQLEADLALAKKEVALMTQDLDLANETIDQARTDLALMQKEYEEYSKSAADAATSALEVYQAQARLREQRAALQQAQAKRAKVEEDLAATIGDRNALVAKAEASLNEAKYRLARTKVVAPSQGYVTNLQLTAGTYADAGAPVMSLIDSENWWIVANFPENSLVLLKPGQAARVAFGLVPGRVFKATVESVGRGVGEGQGVPSGDLPQVSGPTDWVKTTQRFPVRLRLDAPDAAGELRVGGTGTVLVYATDNFALNALGWVWLKVASLLNFLS